MFNFSWSSPAPLAGTIRVKERVYRLGPLTDIDGKKWDIRAIINDIVCAVPEHGLHPYYRDTSGADYDFVSQTWLPYQVEVVK